MAIGNVQRIERQSAPNSGQTRITAANTNTRPTVRNVVPMRKKLSGGEMVEDANPYYDTTDEQFSKQYDHQTRYQEEQNPNINRVEGKYVNYNEPGYIPSGVPQVVRSKKVKHKPSKAKVTGARLRASTVNTWVLGWSITWYLTFQWWMGLVSLVGLGMAYAVYDFAETVEGDGGVFNIKGQAVRAASAILAVARDFLKLDFDPIYISLIPAAILLLLGILFLLTICIIYYAAGVKALSGEAKGWKITTFIIALVSSVTPLPMVFLWLGVVWFNPR